MIDKPRALRNRTISLTTNDISFYSRNLISLSSSTSFSKIKNKTIHQNLFDVIDLLPSQFVDVLFLDPPYNLNKDFNGNGFKERTIDEYAKWIEAWLSKLVRTLKPTASIYICSDWRTSTSIHLVAEKYFTVRNRITWEREKGRGAKTNWKNNTEDIWFCTMSNEYTFNIDAVKLKRKVIAPYKENGKPKDWSETEEGNFRLTHPSNIWNDISIPFWSMPENTEHPTQKPEKLLAKIILGSTNENDVVFDPFLGSGTTSVVAKKLNRNYIGIEQDLKYCCLAEKRLQLAEENKAIQGYSDGVFWERNTFNEKLKV
ncbi:MAG: site-specific DNA-methyltransferase [Ignavibacteria bacterium]|nr:site-specific DNA-methyltransferase [Ignavibacteria bacterium]